MLKTLDEIRAMFPNAKYPPDPNCSKCHGEGYWFMPPEKCKGTSFKPDEPIACICAFVARDFAQEAGGMLGEFAKKMRQNDGTSRKLP